jgi:(p)ppGpp synthase/HD superfamily hydrolase
MTRLTDAVVLAAELHADQRRKASKVPYLAHLLQVCGMVLEDGGSEDDAIAALLHDAPEDQGGEATLLRIRQAFGERVAAIVAGCSDAMPARGEAKAPWRERKTLYLAHLEAADASVLRVSLADRLQNGRSLLADLAISGAATWDRFNAGPSDQAWFFGAALDVYERRLPGSWNLPEFRQAVHEIQAAAVAAGPG